MSVLTLIPVVTLIIIMILNVSAFQ